ncbi:MAG: LAGLIDADG family homing endonuclease [Bacteroidota bacterium]|jgi:hypothetical protein|nr:hypothetical protein [Ignavibacteria bacterium]HEX2960589.1 LAGLIDADG family homing endonuclease [Ignavibacteriales bacterium]MCU7499932.1 hypothetical protein [Ignavibacteria bacterium]MCU7513211.1 hypothetical protein [Ignavibacteria bacterium]MCU7521459.1 hypothetical protein [Ignavibacteria bacterium]
MWAMKFNQCRECHSTDFPHKALGLCVRCYAKRTEKRHKFRKSQVRGSIKDVLTFDYLNQLYVIEQKSMADIAMIVGGSRQYVNKRIKELGIQFREKSAARQLALLRKKIIASKTGLVLQHVVYDTSFFKSWTANMAYVLGVVFTDGNISEAKFNCEGFKTTCNTSRLSISQKEPELLEKIRSIMGTNARISARKNNGIIDSLYILTLNNDEMYHDLLCLGVTPNKSLTIQYPQVPEEFEWHFIRGLWDGDGSIYKDNGYGRAKFVSGSKEFIYQLRHRLLSYDLQVTKVYPNHRSYELRITKKESLYKMRDLIYRDTTENNRLDRKYIRFMSF